ncbi:peptide chain release factor 1, partial [candidate division TA06 bacterium]
MLNNRLIEKLDILEDKHKKIQQDLSDPAVIKDINRFKELSQEEKEISLNIDYYDKYKTTLK